MILRRNFITLLGGAVAWPLAAGAQQGGRVRRIGVLIGRDENDPVAKTYVSAFTQALAGLGWTDGQCGWTPVGAAATSIEYKRSPRSWLACDPTSFLQARPRRPLPSIGRRKRSRSSLRAAIPSPAASSRGSTSRAGTSPVSSTTKPPWEVA
jgi:hypothetical protein